MMKNIAILFALVSNASAYSAGPSKFHQKTCSSRKAFLQKCTFASTAIFQTIAIAPNQAQAFDGTGSSAYAGRTPASKAELKKSYQTRIIADVKDFKNLGEAISSKGQTEGDAWVNFFIEFQRREPDAYGRAYAANVDLVGGKDISGCGTLLAASYTKPGKPADGTPPVKKYNAMAKLFDPIKAAGKKGDVAKAKVAWEKASVALSEYLETVELPPSLSDPIYD